MKQLSFYTRLAAGCLCTCLVIPGLAQTEREPRKLSVEGIGEVAARPNMATVRFGAVAQAKEASEAQSTVNQKMQAIVEAVRELEIPSRDIQTSTLQLLPVYAQRRPRPVGSEDEEPEIRGFRALNVVQVRVQALDKLGDVIDAALEAGANQIEGISFSLQDDSPQRAQALARAAEEARDKARAMAEALSVRLGSVYRATESQVDLVRPQFRAMAMSVSDGTPIEAGEVRVHARVTVEFLIEER